MEKLLQWSIAQTTGDKSAQEKVGAPDPELLQQLFGQLQDDPTLMKQNMFIIKSEEADLENKLIACDNFEMLVENLDNAMNIENLKLWPDLIEKLDAKELSASVASIIGTALQNNEKSKLDFLKHEGGLDKLVGLVRSTTTENEKVKLKALYALSSLLRHNLEAVELFIGIDSNIDVIITAGLGSHISKKMSMKTLSLLSAILSVSESHAKLLSPRHEIVTKMIELLQEGDADVKEKVANIIAHDLIRGGYKFTTEETLKLASVCAELDEKDFNPDDYDLIKQVSLN